MIIDPDRRSALLRLRASLSDTLDLIDHGLPGSARVVLPSAFEDAKPLDPDGRRRREHLPSDFAHIGGRGVVPGHTEAFASPWWRDSYRPGPLSEVFIAFCDGQSALRHRLRQPCYFVEACGPGQAWGRIKIMKQERVGSGCFLDGRYIEDGRSWSNWNLCMLSTEIVPSPNSPVAVSERGIVVRLPDTLDAGRFEADMTAQVRKGSLAAWLRTEEGRRHCALLGVEPSTATRFTSAAVGTGGDPQPVENIVIRGQRAAQQRLIEIAERMILSHLRERQRRAA